MVHTEALTRERVNRLIQACFADLAASVNDGFIPTTNEPDLERAYQRAMTEENTGVILGQLDVGRFWQPVETEVLLILRRLGIDVGEIGEARLNDLNVGVARALLERDRLFLHRMSERLLPYEPIDPLFQRPLNDQPTTVAPGGSTVLGPTLGAALDVYLAQGQREWSPKTWRGRKRQLGYLREHLGNEKPMTTITPQDIVTFRDALRRLRPRSHRDVGETFIAKQTDNEGARISATTVENLFNPCKAFFSWAKGQQGLIAINPAEDVRMPRVKKVKGAKSRRSFTAEELNRIFTAPVFTGMRSSKRRFAPGKIIAKDAHYWIPILGYYTGARLGELVQLHLADIRLDDLVPHFVITEEGSAERGTGEEKMVKSHAGVRRVPLHQDLLDLGFADFVRRRLKDKRSEKRLFWQVGFGADGQASTVFSKWFARLLDSVGLKDPALVFHSFRHTAEDAFRNALLPKYVIDRIIGHAGGDVSDGYGNGVSLEVCGEAVAKMKLLYRVRG